MKNVNITLIVNGMGSNICSSFLWIIYNTYFFISDIPVQYFKNIDVIIVGIMKIHEFRAIAIARKRPISDPIIEEYKFTAYRDRK